MPETGEEQPPEREVRAEELPGLVLEEVAEAERLPELALQEILAKAERELPVIEATAAKRIAYTLVIGFLLLIGASVLYIFVAVLDARLAPNQALLFNQGIDLMKTTAAVLAGIVGSVVTYYFGIERRALRRPARQP